MPSSASFGRRAAVPTLQAPPLQSLPSAGRLSPEAEAFRASLVDVPLGEDAAFLAWRRARRGETLMLWGLTIGFATPGVWSFVMDAPFGVSIGLEVAAFIGNAWLRRRRRKRLGDIAAWRPPSEA